MAAPSKSVLFVCYGNICRSPIAEAVFKNLLKQRGDLDQWVVDSCGTGGHEAGSRPDSRGRRLMSSKGIEMEHIARKLRKDDFHKFAHIFGMDDDNMRNINRHKPADSKASIKLLGSLDPLKELNIEDPWYGGDSGFEDVYQQVTRCCTAFLNSKEFAL